MKKGQTSIRGGIQDFLCPFTDMFITQGSDGAYSHKGTMANDVKGIQAGIKYPYYAPCTCKCVRIYPDSGQAMWQSTNKVRFANGRIDYATFMTAHDDSFDAKVGMVVPQGNKLGNMGKKGNATGVHCHIEISQSKTTSWSKNKYGIYCFPNEYDTDACYFMDGTNILNGMGGSWKYLKDVSVEEPKPEPTPEPVIDEDKEIIKKLENDIKELQEDISELKDQNSLYQTENEMLLNENVNFKKENEELKQQLENQPKLIFTSPKTDYYAIKLLEQRELYIK